MIPVEQEESYGCLRACVASILELRYEDVPATLAQEDGQTTAFLCFMASRGFSVGDYSLYGSKGLPDEPQPTCSRYWPTFWIASVLSPRLRDTCGRCGGSGEDPENDPTRPPDHGALCRACKGEGWLPGWHSVVMKGHEMVWDPHPKRADGHLGFVHASVPYVIDPARVIVKVIP